MTQETVVKLVQAQLQNQRPGGATLEVVPEGILQQDGSWYIPVRPNVQPPKMFEYYEALAEVESTLEENEQLQIWLMPMLPEEEIAAAGEGAAP